MVYGLGFGVEGWNFRRLASSHQIARLLHTTLLLTTLLLTTPSHHTPSEIGVWVLSIGFRVQGSAGFYMKRDLN